MKPANQSARPDTLQKQGVFIERYLDPFRKYLLDPEVSEICVNRSGEIWIERIGLPAMERVESTEVTDEHLERLARQIASISEQSINSANPLLSASLPTGERVQMVIPPAALTGVALAIRKQTIKDMTLDDYAKTGAFEDVKLINDSSYQENDKYLRNLAEQRNFKEFISLAAKGKKNILISGGTSTGKTTLLNAILREIDPNERIITIEDTAEVHPCHKNHLSLIACKGEQGTARVTIQDLLEASLRLRPDRILLGELRGKEAYTFLRAVNTGHPGSLTTVHADTPSGALEQIGLMVMQTGLGLEHKHIKEYISSIIDVVIQLKRIGGKRIISEVWYP